MPPWSRTLSAALVSGAVASAASTVALAVLARAEGKHAVQPLNATSHWLNGDQAGAFERIDLGHTAVGYATHHAATVFWAAIFEHWTASARSPASLPTLRRALAMSAIAAAVDYGLTPKRFTPGWEFVLSKRAMATAYAAMALGLAAGVAITRPRR